MGKGVGVGVLQRFERRLGGLVEGAFARVFGGVVQPVEVAAALQREAEDRKAIVGQGRVLVPNDYVVELGRSDSARLGEYDEPLRRELAGIVEERAAESGWSFVGPVQVHLEEVDDLATGVFRVRSAVLTNAPAQPTPHPYARPPAAAAPVPPPVPAPPPSYQPPPSYAPAPASQPAPAYGAPPPRRSPPYLVLAGAEGGQTEQVTELTGPVTRLGRSRDAHVQLHDTGVSRLHAEIRLDEDHGHGGHGGEARIVDLRSTNGTTVNGRRVDSAPLHDGDRIGVGTTTLVFRRDP